MAENTNIPWCDSTFNPWWGCTKVGPGCDNCYAEALAKRYGKDVWGPGKARMETKGPWNDVRRWQREAPAFFAEHGRKRRVFCASMADVFDNEVDELLRGKLWETIKACPDLNFLIVTKRIGNFGKMIPADWIVQGMPKNVGIMSTIVNQEEADRDIPKLLDAKARYGIKWVGLSMEPLLGPVDLTRIEIKTYAAWGNALTGDWKWEGGPTNREWEALDWVIVGGESGPKWRKMQLEWAWSLMSQTKQAGVPFFFKQVSALRPTDNMIESELRIRQYPRALL